MVHYTQLSNKLHMEYTEAMWDKAIRWNWVFDEYVLKRIFIERLPDLIRHCMQSSWLEEEWYRSGLGATCNAITEIANWGTQYQCAR